MRQFGQSSERYIKSDPDQLRLDFGGEVQLEQEREYLRAQSSRTGAAASPIKTHPVRKPLPDNLERRDEVIEPASLPEGSKYIGDEVTEILEFIPGQLYVRRCLPTLGIKLRLTAKLHTSYFGVAGATA